LTYFFFKRAGFGAGLGSRLGGHRTELMKGNPKEIAIHASCFERWQFVFVSKFNLLKTMLLISWLGLMLPFK
jgi:hypothetical protein